MLQISPGTIEQEGREVQQLVSFRTIAEDGHVMVVLPSWWDPMVSHTGCGVLRGILGCLSTESE